MAETPACYGSDPRFVTPERRRELLAERFRPWPLPQIAESRPLLAKAKWTPEPAKRLKIATKADV